MKGRVTLVGAGPGKDLITLRGFEKIKTADVIVYDDLIDDRILSEAKESCKKIYVGKRYGKHSKKQEEINKILIENCKAGKEVLRLKGGDSFVFGRGGEEALALMEEGLSWDYVPGVSSAIAVPGIMGIPVTHRGIARSFTVVTGHTKDGSGENYEALAKLNGTLVFLMGLNSINEITSGLIENGMAIDTPASILCKGFSHGEKRIDGTLGDITSKAMEAETPAILVIGQVAGMELYRDTEDILKGVSVTVTGTNSFINRVRSLLTTEGASVFGIEGIRIKEKPDNIPEDLDEFEWMAFTSSNGIRVFFDELRKRNYDLRKLSSVKIACIGMGTAKTLSEYGIYADFVPDRYTAKDLGQELPKVIGPGEKLLILRAENGSLELNHELDRACLTYRDEKIYETIPVSDVSEETGELVDTDYLVFGSAAGVRAFFESGKVDSKTKVICIGNITAEEASKWCNIYKVSEKHTAEGILEILKKEME